MALISNRQPGDKPRRDPSTVRVGRASKRRRSFLFIQSANREGLAVDGAEQRSDPVYKSPFTFCMPRRVTDHQSPKHDP